MPFYLYSNPLTGEVKEVYQKMSEPHVYNDCGVEWFRVFTIPQAIVDGRIDPCSKTEFLRKTENKKGTLGNLMDTSRELSVKRNQLFGKDPFKEKFFDDYSKKRWGKQHLEQRPKEIKNNFVEVSL